MTTPGGETATVGHDDTATGLLLNVVDALTLEPDFERFFERAADAAREFVRADGAALILLTDDDQLEYQFFQGALSRLRRFTGFRFARDSGTVGAALSEGRTIMTGDYAADPHAMEAFVVAGLKANLIIPLSGADGPLGALALSWFQTPQDWPEPRSLLLAEKVAAQIAVACQRRALELRLQEAARRDELTGLLNRTGMMQALEQRLQRNARDGQPFALIVIDMDGFKAVNDHFGHAAGDELLRDAARRLNAMCRREDAVARIGGDEFVILAGLRHGFHDIAPLLDRLAATLSVPVTSPGRSRCTASIGVAVCAEDGSSAEALLRRADLAMYQVKHEGGQGYRRYLPVMERRLRERERTRDAVADALQNRQLLLHYQPIHQAADHRMVAAECLVRWNHPERGLISAAEFMPAVEAAGSELVRALDRWVLGAALGQLREWRRIGVEHPALHVNVSARHFIAGDFAGYLADALAETPEVPPQCLVLELTETALIDNMDAAESTTRACRDLGVQLALDDFGTGYASLTYLKRLSADIVKVDGDFVMDLFDSASSEAILRGILAMADALGLTTVAEGVESLAHANAVRELGCDLLQGYGLSHPLPVDALHVVGHPTPHRTRLA